MQCLEQLKRLQEMYRLPLKHVVLLLLLALLPLVVMACGGDGGSADQESTVRTIPEDSLATEGERLPAGEYVSDEFRPAMSFRLDEGWRTGVDVYRSPGHSHRRLPAHGESLEMRDILTLFYAPEGKLVGTVVFLVDPRVYRVVNSHKAEKEPTPEDMLAWLQQNPYLDAEDPKPATVGGKRDARFEAVPSRVPEDYITCVEPEPCLPLFQPTNPDLSYTLIRADKARFLVFKDVGGKTVTIAIKAQDAEFDKFSPRAQKLIKTVKWRSQ